MQHVTYLTSPWVSLKRDYLPVIPPLGLIAFVLAQGHTFKSQIITPFQRESATVAKKLQSMLKESLEFLHLLFNGSTNNTNWSSD